MSQKNYDDLDAKVTTLLSKLHNVRGISSDELFDSELTSLLDEYGYTDAKDDTYSRIKGKKYEVFGKKNPLVFLEGTTDDYFYIEFSTLAESAQFIEDVEKNQSKMIDYELMGIAGASLGALIGTIVTGIITINAVGVNGDAQFSKIYFNTAKYIVPIGAALLLSLGFGLAKNKYDKQYLKKSNILNHYEPEQSVGKNAIAMALTRPD